MNGQQENARLWPARGLGGVELLHARYRRQRFAPHVHEGYVFTVIERGESFVGTDCRNHLDPGRNIFAFSKPGICIKALYCTSSGNDVEKPFTYISTVLKPSGSTKI